MYDLVCCNKILLNICHYLHQNSLALYLVSRGRGRPLQEEELSPKVELSLVLNDTGRLKRSDGEGLKG